MTGNFTNKDIEDAKKIVFIFSNLSEDKKTQAIIYLSALRDKETADYEKQERAKTE